MSEEKGSLNPLLPKPSKAEEDDKAIPLTNVANDNDEDKKDEKPDEKPEEESKEKEKEAKEEDDPTAPLLTPRLSLGGEDAPENEDKEEDVDVLDPISESDKEKQQGAPAPPPAPTVNSAADIGTAEEEQTYCEFLETIETDRNAIKEHLHELVRKNFVKKLEKLCEFMRDKELPLAAEDLLGNKSKETVLCLAIIMGNTESAEVLIEYGGTDLIVLEYQSKQHKGLTALHLAILKQNVQIIEKMLENLDTERKSNFVHKMASGTHFEQRFNCPCLPLSLAAGVGNIGIFNILVEHGADVWIADNETGNTVLHSLAAIAVYSPQASIYTMTEILKSPAVQGWWSKRKQEDTEKKFSNVSLKAALLKAENKDGHTPFIYASCLGANDFAKAILDIEQLYKFPQWEVGPSSYVLHEVSEIDTAIPASSLPNPPNLVVRQDAQKTKALEIFAFVLGDDDIDYGKIPAINQAMINKWESYKGWFMGWMILHFIVMVAFSVSATFFEPTTADSVNETDFDVNSTSGNSSSFRRLTRHLASHRNRAIVGLDTFVFLVGVVYFILEIIDMAMLLNKRFWRSKGYGKTKKSKAPLYLTLQFDIFRTLLFIFGLFVIITFCLKLARSPWEDFTYAVSAIAGWGFMLFFTRAFQNVGIFTVMLQRMITREMMYFSVVFAFTMAGFSTATFVLFREIDTEVPSEVASLERTFYSHFRLLVGLEEFQVEDDSRLPWMARAVFVMFVLLANILMLNMLIAAMNNTYTNLDNLKEPMWLKMRIRAVLMLERRLIPKLRPKSNLKTFGSKKQWFLASEEVKAWHPLAGGSDVVI